MYRSFLCGRTPDTLIPHALSDAMKARQPIDERVLRGVFGLVLGAFGLEWYVRSSQKKKTKKKPKKTKKKPTKMIVVSYWHVTSTGFQDL
jgi:hypothetical protein